MGELQQTVTAHWIAKPLSGQSPPPLPLLLSSMHYSVYGMHKVNVTSRRRYLRSTFAVPFSVAKFSEPFALGRASMD